MHTIYDVEYKTDVSEKAAVLIFMAASGPYPVPH